LGKEGERTFCGLSRVYDARDNTASKTRKLCDLRVKAVGVIGIYPSSEYKFSRGGFCEVPPSGKEKRK